MAELFDISRDDMLYRYMGGGALPERIGAGVFEKKGVSIDFADWNLKYYSLVYVIAGQGRYIDSNGYEYALHPGCFLQRIPGKRHSTYLDPESGWRECFIDIGPLMFEALSASGIIRTDISVFNIGLDLSLAERFSRLVHMLRELVEEELPEVVPEVISLINVFSGRMRIAGNTHDDLMIKSACEYLSEDLDERINMRKFCRVNKWGYEKFRKLFTEKMGMPPVKYRIRKRIDAACRMLIDKSLSIGEIALKLGYPSPYEFSAQFKKYTGTAPKFFRESLPASSNFADQSLL